MIVSGGRDKNIQDVISTDIYDTETSEWKKFPSLGLFRHSCFMKDHLYVFGGFENRSPNVPISNLYRIDLNQYLASSTHLLNKLTPQITTKPKETVQNQPISNNNPIPFNKDNNIPQNFQSSKMTSYVPNTSINTNLQNNTQSINTYGHYPILNQLLEFSVNKQSNIMDNNNKIGSFILSSQAIVIQSTEEIDDMTSIMRRLDIDKLSQESKRIGQESMNIKVQQKRFYNEDIVDKFIDLLLRPFDWANNPELEAIHANLPFSKEEIDILLKEVAKVIYKEKSLISIRSPVKIFGNIFGQYYDLMRFFETYCNPSDVNPMGDININNYVFLGDFCDRGIYCLEVIYLLFALKVKYPDSVFLIRGHHEDEFVNKKFGLFEECERRSEDPYLFEKINAIFDIFPFGCLVDNKILCVHGGIGSSVKNLSDISNIQRPVSIPLEVKTNDQQILIDLLYSEFTEDTPSIMVNEERDTSKTGNIVKFGKDRVSKFLAENGLALLVTSHCWIPEGVKAYNNDKIILVYSSTNHMDKAGNIAGMLNLTKNCNHAIPKLIDTFKNDKKYYKKNINQLSPLKYKK